MLLRSVPPPVCLRHPPDYRWTIDLTVRDRQSGDRRSRTPATRSGYQRRGRSTDRLVTRMPSGHPSGGRKAGL